MLKPAKKKVEDFRSLLVGGRIVTLGADVEYIPSFIQNKYANRLLEELIDTAKWSQPEIQVFGRTHKIPRLSAWYGNTGAIYRYSGLVNKPMPWLPNLLALRGLIEERLNHSFNSVLLNLYRNGTDSMGCHRDNEPELGQNPVIASVSLGSIRRFLLRRQQEYSRRTIECRPENGSLLVMRGNTQKCWRHCIPKTQKLVEPRLNLTFRQILVEMDCAD